MLPFSNMRRDEPKLLVERVQERAEKRQESIVAKCHPAIFELAQLWRESIEARKSLGTNPPPELIAEIDAKMEERLKAIKKKYSGPVSPAPNTFAAQIIFSDSALKSQSDGQGIIESLHWERWKTPLRQDVEKARARDWDASRRVQRTISDLEQLRCGKGPIQPFKGDVEHGNMFDVLWGFGIERLTPEETADFFDSYCPCGSEGHDPDALKKQRARFQKVLSKSIAEVDAIRDT